MAALIVSKEIGLGFNSCAISFRAEDVECLRGGESGLESVTHVQLKSGQTLTLDESFESVNAKWAAALLVTA